MRILRNLLSGDGSRARRKTPLRILGSIVEALAWVVIVILLITVHAFLWVTVLFVIVALAISMLISEHLVVIDAVRIDQESDETKRVAAEAGPEV